MVEEDGKFYQVIRAAGKDALSMTTDCSDELCKLEDRYGPVLLRKKTPVFLSFLEREADVFEEILANLREQGLAEEKRSARYAEVELLLRENRLAGTSMD